MNTCVYKHICILCVSIDKHISRTINYKEATIRLYLLHNV